MVFFLDRNLGKYTIVGALREAGADAEIHDDHFPNDARDEQWLREVARRGWIVLTKDERIRYRSNECTALMQAGGRAFVVVAQGNSPAHIVAEVLVKALPSIRRFVTRQPPPFIAKVTRSSKVSLWVGR